MDDISRKTYEKNGIKMIEDIDGILWLHKKQLEEGSNLKRLRKVTTKYHFRLKKT